MEDGLVQQEGGNGHYVGESLNPCCDGRWSRTAPMHAYYFAGINVLILVVMEDGLVPVLNVLIVL